MGVFRTKENVDDFFEKDPFDLFRLDLPSEKSRASRRTGFWSSLFLGAFLALVVAGAGFWAVTREQRAKSDSPFAYFEMRVISPDGRPVAGAMIREGKKQLGVTDSFGEWRRFMRVHLGSSILFDIKKETASRSLVATKSLAIPLTAPKSGDLEIKGSVQLEPEGGSGSHERRMVERPSVKTNESFARPPETIDVTPTESAQTLPPPQTSAAEPDMVATVKTSSNGTDQGGQGNAVDQGAIWFEADGGNTEAIAPLLGALKQRSLELGLRVVPDSAWRLRILDLTAQGARLVRVEGLSGPRPDGPGLFRYLRTQLESPAQTARDILRAATVHATKSYQINRDRAGWRILPPSEPLWALTSGKVLFDQAGRTHAVITGPQGEGLFLAPDQGDPCGGAPTCLVTSPGAKRLPPVSGWQLMSLRVLAGGGDQPQVYVSGYEAHPRDGNLYEYWGLPQGAANISVLRGDRVVYRERVPIRVGVTPTVHLPSPPVAQLTR